MKKRKLRPPREILFYRMGILMLLVAGSIVTGALRPFPKSAIRWAEEESGVGDTTLIFELGDLNYPEVKKGHYRAYLSANEKGLLFSEAKWEPPLGWEYGWVSSDDSGGEPLQVMTIGKYSYHTVSAKAQQMRILDGGVWYLAGRVRAPEGAALRVRFLDPAFSCVGEAELTMEEKVFWNGDTYFICPLPDIRSKRGSEELGMESFIVSAQLLDRDGRVLFESSSGNGHMEPGVFTK